MHLFTPIFSRVRRIRASALLLFATGFGLAPAAAAAPVCADAPMLEGAELRIHQVNTILDGVATENSGWGFAQLSYFGDVEVLYFNLAMPGTWQIENIPMLSGRGPGELHTEYMAFDLRVLPGENVEWLQVGVSLTTVPLAEAPECNIVLPVDDMTVDMSSGIRRDTMLIGDPGSMKGGATANAAKSNGTIQNQECGKNECVPAAVSNALKSLNDRFRLGIDTTLITIAALKVPLEWRSTGCNATNWPDLKKAYLEDKDIPVTSEEVEAPANNQDAARLMKRLMRERKRNCQIEMTVEGHCVLLTEIAPIEGTNDYTLTVQHDTEQGKDGGTIAQKVVYSPNTQKIKEGWLLNGKKVINFVIQCRERTE